MTVLTPWTLTAMMRMRSVHVTHLIISACMIEFKCDISVR